MVTVDTKRVAGAARRSTNLLTVSEVAERLGMSTSWVRKRANANKPPVIPSVKLGMALRFRPEEIDQFVEDCSRVAVKRAW